MTQIYIARSATILIAIFLLLLLMLGTRTAPLQAQEDNAFAIDWWTVDGGGGESGAGNFALHGSLGQPDAGTFSADIYRVEGGFWTNSTVSSGIYLPALHLADTQ